MKILIIFMLITKNVLASNGCLSSSIRLVDNNKFFSKTTIDSYTEIVLYKSIFSHNSINSKRKLLDSYSTLLDEKLSYLSLDPLNNTEIVKQEIMQYIAKSLQVKNQKVFENDLSYIYSIYPQINTIIRDHFNHLLFNDDVPSYKKYIIEQYLYNGLTNLKNDSLHFNEILVEEVISNAYYTFLTVHFWKVETEDTLYPLNLFSYLVSGDDQYLEAILDTKDLSTVLEDITLLKLFFEKDKAIKNKLSHFGLKLSSSELEDNISYISMRHSSPEGEISILWDFLW